MACRLARTDGRPTFVVGAIVALMVGSLAIGCRGTIDSGPSGTAADQDEAGSGGPFSRAADDRAERATSTDPVFRFALSNPSRMPGLRMMTHVELERTISGLTGLSPDLSELPAPLETEGLRNDATSTPIRDANHQRQMLALATDIATRANLDAVFPCATPCTALDVGALLETSFGSMPPAEARDRYVAIYENALQADEAFARQAVLQAALMSPLFLFRTEVGGPDGTLTPSELARKLSYFLWGRGPDARLLQAARDGSLADEAMFQSEVDRMLDDPRTARRVADFFFDWLNLDGFDLVAKGLADEVPEGTDEAMIDEVELLVYALVVERGAPLSELFRSQTTWINPALAELYEIDGVTGPDFREVSLEGTGRRGILTTALVLSAHGKETGRSPMQRGDFLLHDVMCHTFPIGAGVPQMDLPDGEESFREKFDALVRVQPCSNCHRTLNAGFAFDVFDPVGRTYPEEVVPPGDTRGSFDLPPYAPVQFANTIEAVEGLSRHPALNQCFVTQLYRFAQGRLPGADDAELLDRLLSRFEANGENVLALFREIALSDRFREATQP